MVNTVRLIILLLAVTLSPLVAESAEYLLFSPSPIEGEILTPERGKGVMVRRITLKTGDTLGRISREYSGRASYFPQILLFNNISNPNLIFAGKELMVPVSKHKPILQKGVSEKKVSLPAIKAKESRPAAKSAKSPRVGGLPKETTPNDTDRIKPSRQVSNDKPGSRSEKDAFSQALAAYRKEDYKKSLALFSRFLEKYPSSHLVPDASFHKAESLFKLSGQ